MLTFRAAVDFETAPDEVSADHTSAEIQGLRPATEYQFRIAGKNDVGVGQYSAILGGTTLEAGKVNSFIQNFVVCLVLFIT